MFTKKFYIPIGALIIAISAIAFFALRSDTPKEPIVIYKATTTEAETPADTPAAVTTGEVTEKSTGGPFHADGEPHSDNTSNQTEAGNHAVPWEIAKLQLTPEKRREIEKKNADFLERHEEWQAEQAQRLAQSDKYRDEVVQYIDNMQAYHKKFQALGKEWDLSFAESEKLQKSGEVAIRTGNREEMLKIRDALLDEIAKRKELQKRQDDLEVEKPIAPIPPASMERSRN